MEFEGFIEIKPGLWYCKKDGTPWSNKNNNHYNFLNYLKKLNSKTAGYYSVRIANKTHLWHRLVYEHFKGSIPEDIQVDHKDNNRSNCLIDNLQLLNNQHNNFKKQKNSRNKSKYPGVSLNKNYKRFEVKLSINSKNILLGYFDDPLEAFVCYLENKIFYHGWDSILPLV